MHGGAILNKKRGAHVTTLEREERTDWTRIICFLSIALCVCAIYVYATYITICGFRIPVMDFCRWIAWYGEKYHTGTMSFISLFSDKNEQIQPLSIGLTFSVLEKSNYNMWPLVKWGAVLRIILAVVTALLVAKASLKKTGLSAKIFVLIASATIVICSLNPNQWELTIEPFALSMAIRLICYFVFFFFVSKLLQVLLEFSYRYQLLSVLLVSSFAAAISLLLSGAYFVAFLGSLSAVFLHFSILNRKRMSLQHIPIMMIWLFTVIGCFAAYIRSVTGGIIISATAHFKDYVQGIIIYLGTAIFPQHWSESTLIPFEIVGMIYFALCIYIFYRYLHTKAYEDSYMPLMLFLYSIINGFVISYGRVPYFGISVMSSSRYTIESILGVVGLLWAGIQVYPTAPKQNVKKGLFWIILLVISICNGMCYGTEIALADSRAAYQASMRDLMFRVNSVSDMDLEIFQEDPVYVREMIAFFQQYHLSVFDEAQKLPGDLLPNTEYSLGVYDDMWTSADVRMGIKTGPEGIIKFQCYIPGSILKDNPTIAYGLVGGTEHEESITSEHFEIVVYAVPNDYTEIYIKPQFSFSADFPDVRELSVHIDKIDIE